MGLFFSARFADALESLAGERKSLPLLFGRNCKESEGGDSCNCDRMYIGENGVIWLEQLSCYNIEQVNGGK